MNIVAMLFFTAIALGVLVTFHEYGHFWVARRCGVKVLRFSIGFGTSLLKWRDKKGTEFVIAALPLGGYVKMVDEREGPVDPQDLDFAFNRKSVWKRIAIVSAGPLANFILAIIFYWVIFLGGIQGLAPVVGGVIGGSPVDIAGLRGGDEITAVDGVPVSTTQELRERLINRIGETGILALEVKPADATTPYSLDVSLDRWLADADEIDPVAGLGIELYRPEIPPVADKIVPGSAAEKAGLLPGDRVLSADGLEMKDWDSWVEYVRERPGQPIAVTLERGNEHVALKVTPDAVAGEDGDSIGQVGMSVVVPPIPEHLIRETNYTPFGAIKQAIVKTGDNAVMILDSIGKMLEGLISAKHLSGPITIAKVAGTSAQYGVVAYLGFLAFLSVSLGVLNLLPIPVLDGGHLLYFIVEAIKGSPVSEKIQLAGFRVGIVLVVGLMVVALYNDLMRL